MLAVDILSKYVWTAALKTTRGQEMMHTLTQIFASGWKPTRIRSDQGTEFVNQNIKDFLKKVKALYSERAIKTIKSRLVRYMTHKQVRRWFDILLKITESYNSTYHQSNKRTPSSVKATDSVYLWKLQYGYQAKKAGRKMRVSRVRDYKYKVGDLVRVSFMRRAFQREYDECRSRELFLVNQRFMRRTFHSIT